MNNQLKHKGYIGSIEASLEDNCLFGKILFFFFVFSWVKATVPRYRYDQLMRLGWKIFLPISLLWIFLISGYLMLTRYS